MRILIVEDEPGLAHALCELFRIRHHHADRVATAFAAMEAALSNAYDCIILDVRLPDDSGFQVVKDLREAGCATPILMLTVQNEPADRVRGLHAGADDYLGKPFDPEELMARIHALIRRTSTQRDPDELRHGRAVLHRPRPGLHPGAAGVR
ncbi:hypothetical protein GCM10010885_19670 [Alicyclobacillus cellulosilyticus]|uniref:Response regulatory domain-containing protein n=1 Tax=Alicyclobacillus cellulosilyticus TaxID=1003997 RepID=A0A917KG98_9BACL|nr:response regulator [Alicyclobacillus cellulosilyticus]GGJ10532.1 hypothetical protein GCM10010885_19670 [Alicyclobacillus cellulosilyticus]